MIFTSMFEFGRSKELPGAIIGKLMTRTSLCYVFMLLSSSFSQYSGIIVYAGSAVCSFIIGWLVSEETSQVKNERMRNEYRAANCAGNCSVGPMQWKTEVKSLRMMVWGVSENFHH